MIESGDTNYSWLENKEYINHAADVWQFVCVFVGGWVIWV